MRRPSRSATRGAAPSPGARTTRSAGPTWGTPTPRTPSGPCAGDAAPGGVEIEVHAAHTVRYCTVTVVQRCPVPVLEVARKQTLCVPTARLTVTLVPFSVPNAPAHEVLSERRSTSKATPVRVTLAPAVEV